MSDSNLFHIEVSGQIFHSAAIPALQDALAAAHRQEPAFCLCNESKSQLVIKRYAVRNAATHVYGLARWPDSGLEHEPSCHFFGDEVFEVVSAEEKPAFADLDDGRSRAFLATTLKIIEKNVQAIAARKAQGAPNPVTQKKASELALLLKLWRMASLNIYRGKPRPWFNATFNMLRAAEKITVNAEGESLAQYLLIGAGKADRLAIEHNATVLDHAAKRYTRLFVIGRLKPVGRDKQRMMLSLLDFQGLPRISVKLDQLDGFMRDKPLCADLMQGNAGNVVVIAIIEPSRTEWWTTLQIGAITTSADMIPIETTAELAFERHLVAQERTFISPVVVDGGSDYNKGSPFILLDTTPRTYCDVMGQLSAAEGVEQGKKAAQYQTHGKALVTWSGQLDAPFPALPPRSTSPDSRNLHSS